MVNDPKKEEIKVPLVETGGVADQAPTLKETGEKRETAATHDQADQNAIRESIETIDLDDSQATQAQGHADDAASLADEEKIQHLFEVAKKKGVIVAVAAARKLNNPHVLDTLHDLLAQNGYYKEFLK